MARGLASYPTEEKRAYLQGHAKTKGDAYADEIKRKRGKLEAIDLPVKGEEIKEVPEGTTLEGSRKVEIPKAIYFLMEGTLDIDKHISEIEKRISRDENPEVLLEPYMKRLETLREEYKNALKRVESLMVAARKIDLYEKGDAVSVEKLSGLLNFGIERIIQKTEVAARVQFEDEKARSEAIVALALEGYSFKTFKDKSVGLSSKEQLEFLSKKELKYKILG